MGNGLARIPLQVDADWRGKTVTTDPPRYTPHTEWSLVIGLRTSTRIHAAVFLSYGQETFWELHPSPAARAIELTVSFFPHDWMQSDEVQIAFGGPRINVTDRGLKHDPPKIVVVRTPREPETGVMVAVAEVPAHGILLEVLALVELDIEPRRQDRWRVKPELRTGLPDRLAPLASGRQSGVTRR
jgi:hypothetical protein